MLDEHDAKAFTALIGGLKIQEQDIRVRDAEIERLEDLILRVNHCCVGRESCDGQGPHEALAEADAIRARRKGNSDAQPK